MLRKFILPAAVVLVGSSIMTLLVIAKPKPSAHHEDAEVPLVQVSAMEIAPRSEQLTVNTQGTVYAKREIDLVAQVAGQIVAVDPSYAEGGFFEEQHVLVQIDPSDYDVAVLSAQAKKADAQRRLAEEEGLARQAKREWRDLGNQQANDLFMRKPQLAAAHANVQFSDADLAKAKLNLQRTSVSAPFAGRIKSVHADLGQYVTPGTPIVRVYDSEVLEVRVPLTESQAALLALPFDQATTNPSDVLVSGVLAGQALNWQGTLSRMDSYVDPNTRMYHAVVEVPRLIDGIPQAALIPGLFVNVQIAGKTLDNVLSLPRGALFKQDQIWVVDGENKVSSVVAKVLRKTPERVWVAAELSGAVRVVLDKQGILQPGMEVDPQLEAGEGQVATKELATKGLATKGYTQ